ncbi:MAG: hypothetical protein K9L61_00230 [Candidatus Omnitrophica bacterium]|nr:hypothetical protein [Candidatus Omnitrophota bacterium]
MKFKNCIFILIIFIFFISGFNLFIGISLAQDNSGKRILNFKSREEIEKNEIVRRVEEFADRLKSDSRLMPLYLYKAAVLDSPSTCDLVKGPEGKESCLGEIEDINRMHNYAIGRCSVFEDEGTKYFCEILKENSCRELPGKIDILFCQGLLNLNPQRIESSLKKEIEEGKLDAKLYKKELEFALRELAYYAAFKTNSALTCSQLLGDVPYFRKAGCYILTSNFPQEIIDRYALDLSYYRHSIKEANPDLCKEIKDPYIKKFCDAKINFSIFMQEYFLYSKE